jgi:hypothetical protein
MVSASLEDGHDDVGVGAVATDERREARERAGVQVLGHQVSDHRGGAAIRDVDDSSLDELADLELEEIQRNAKRRKYRKNKNATSRFTPHKGARYVFVISFVDDAAIQGDDVSKMWFINEVQKHLPINL